MYRYFNQYRPEGGMCFSRGGGIGAQRYPFLWAGDQLREFRFLQNILTSILSSGLSGIPFMSYDMAGYMPARDPAGNPEDVVFIRGAQMSCFSSNMQTHGTVTRPYDFAEPVRDIYRSYAKLHEALRPYLLEQAGYACKTGTPLLRHLFLYDPKDPGVLNVEDEYLLGSALLTAPVFSPAEERDIYLPKGNWRNIWDGAVYRGAGTLRAFPAPLRQIPVFLLEGNDSETIDQVLAEARGILGKLTA
jgi:alpha-glucosidase (family GH31 glycosyl hydrolase)